jgi:hypothetical protein
LVLDLEHLGERIGSRGGSKEGLYDHLVWTLQHPQVSDQKLTQNFVSLKDHGVDGVREPIVEFRREDESSPCSSELVDGEGVGSRGFKMQASELGGDVSEHESQTLLLRHL